MTDSNEKLFYPVVHLTVQSILKLDSARYFCPYATSIFIKNLVFLVKGVKNKNTVQILQEFLLKRSESIFDAGMVRLLLDFVHFET